MFHEVRILDQHMRNLEELEALVQDLVAVIAGLHAADVDERNIRVLECLLEDLRFVHEIQLMEGLRRQHDLVYARDVQRGLEPPEGLHRHVMREGLIGHCTGEDGHRATAHRPAGKDYTMHFMLGYLFGYLNTFFNRHAFPAVVPHVCLYHNRHVVLGMNHHFVQHFVQEANAVLKRTAIPVMTMVRTRR